MSNQTVNAIESSIVFVDAAVQNYESLLTGLQPGVEVVLLNPNRDGIEQITAALEGHSGIQSLQIIAHGEPGTLYLGSTRLDAAALDRYGTQLQQWQSALTDNADILLFGCNVAANQPGSTASGTAGGIASPFLQRFSQLTGADIAASNNVTGISGDWDLEVTTGKIEAAAALDRQATQAYKGNLGIITVTNTANSGAGSLRDAIARAQPGDTIQFSSSLANQRITLTSGQISIAKNLTIDGSAAPGLTLSGNKASRIFFVSATNLNVTVRNLAFVDGRAMTSSISDSEGGAIKVRDFSTLTVENSRFQGNQAGRGGAIRVGYGGSLIVRRSTFDSNNGTLANDGFSAGAIATFGAGGSTGTGRLVIEGSTFTNNRGVNGGAVYNLLGPVTIRNSVFRGNQSTQEGGAVFTDGFSGSNTDTVGGTLLIEGSRFESNRSIAGGGALYLWSYTADSAIIRDSTIIGNSVTRGGTNNLGRGGGIEFAGSSLTLTDTAIANNVSPVQGGGLWINNNTASVRITNSTISGNQATQDAGGGMFINSADGRPVAITNSSIVNNLAGRDAGGIWTGGRNSDDVRLTNTLFARNAATTTLQGHSNFTLADGGGNLVQTIVGGRGPVVTQSSRYVADLKLGNLQTMGNDMVHPLLLGSPAINAGTTTGAPGTDQRGITRDSRPDAGAFEFVASTTTTQTARVRSGRRRSKKVLNRSLQSRSLRDTSPDSLSPTGVNAIDGSQNDGLLRSTNRSLRRGTGRGTGTNRFEENSRSQQFGLDRPNDLLRGDRISLGASQGLNESNQTMTRPVLTASDNSWFAQRQSPAPVEVPSLSGHSGF